MTVVIKDYRKIDIIVNNAGAIPHGDFLDMDGELSEYFNVSTLIYRSSIYWKRNISHRVFRHNIVEIFNDFTVDEPLCRHIV